MSEVQKHFDKIAQEYDFWKKKNWYYYENLKNILKEFIPSQGKVLEIGCGTGEILISVDPSYCIGTDISEEMIKIAREKYQNRHGANFYVVGEEPEEKFDFVIVVDVIEHIENLDGFVKDLSKFCHSKTEIIVLMANPLWEPFLLLLEKLRLKMPEGPHKRVSLKEIKKVFEKNNFKIARRGYRQLLPLYIPRFSNLVNKIFYKIPLLKKLGLTEYFILNYAGQSRG